MKRLAFAAWELIAQAREEGVPPDHPALEHLRRAALAFDRGEARSATPTPKDGDA